MTTVTNRPPDLSGSWHEVRPEDAGSAKIRKGWGSAIVPRLPLAALASRHRAALSHRAVEVGLGERVLRGRRAGRQQELDGLVVRLAGLVELHHRRQAAGIAMDHGPVGADLRPQLVVDSRAAGAGRRRGGRAAVRRREPGQQQDRRAVGGRDPRDHPGRDADVPVQQSGRAAGAVDDRRGLRHGPRDWSTRRCAGSFSLAH